MRAEEGGDGSLMGGFVLVDPTEAEVPQRVQYTKIMCEYCLHVHMDVYMVFRVVYWCTYLL